MKVLLLAPQPFYQERGTPIALDLILRTLSARGDEVDALVYHEGLMRSYPGVRLHRIPRVPFLHGVRPGPSFKKLVCDGVFLFSALRLASWTRHDMVHAVEESVFIAHLIKRRYGTPYLYDMDSCMSERIAAKYPTLSVCARWLRAWEAGAIRHAEAVVPVCDALADIAIRSGARKVVVLRDISLLSLDGHTTKGGSALKSELGLHGPTVMYVGNLERYQGLDLLLESFSIARPRVPVAQLVVIGGNPQAIRRYEAMAARLALGASVHFIGPRPVAQMAECFEAADVLVSPRLSGGNTPMKIYSYLASGKAVLATDLPTHTQVLNSDVSLLAKPTRDAFAEGIVRLLKDAKLRRRLGEAGRALADRRYSYPAFQATMQALYGDLERGLSTAAKRVRVLRVIDRLGYGDRLHGAGRVWLNSLPAFRNGCEVIPCVLRLPANLEEQFAHEGIHLRNLKKGRFNPLTIMTLCRLIRRERVDVLHLEGFGSATFGRIAGYLTHTPTVVHLHDMHGTAPWYIRICDRVLAPTTARAVAVSAGVAESCVARLRIPHERVVVVPNALPAGWAQPVAAEHITQLRQTLQIPQRARIVGTVAHLQAEKDVPSLLRAVARLCASGQECHVVVVGEGPDRPQLEQLINQLGLAGYAHLVGFQSDVRPYLALMEVAVFCSLSEGCPNTLLEAMAMGRPLVTTAARGIRELMRDGENGLSVPVRDPEALAHAIERLLKEPALAERMALQVKHDARAFEMPGHAARLEGLYEEIVSGHAGSRGS